MMLVGARAAAVDTTRTQGRGVVTLTPDGRLVSLDLDGTTGATVGQATEGMVVAAQEVEAPFPVPARVREDAAAGRDTSGIIRATAAVSDTPPPDRGTPTTGPSSPAFAHHGEGTAKVVKPEKGRGG